MWNILPFLARVGLTGLLRFINSFLMILAGADPEILEDCKSDDRNNVRLLAIIMLLVWFLQIVIWTAAAHRALVDTGEFRPALLGFAMLLATIVMLLDSYLVMRPGWHRHGEAEHRRAGLDISGGFQVRLKHSGFLLVRLAMAAALAQVSALLLSFILFAPDISGELERSFRQLNAPLFSAAAVRVEEEISGATTAVRESKQRVDVATAEMAHLRQSILEPVVDQTRLRPALHRVAAIEAAKAAADRALEQAEQFATDELAGYARAPGNSGIPGAGPVRAAAEERVQLARRRTAEAGQELTTARRELQEIQAEIDDAKNLKRARAQQRIDELTAAITEERARQDMASASYRRLVDSREETIRDVVMRDPMHVPPAKGFLANVQALSRIAQDPVSASVILVFEAVGFFVECAAILGKIMSGAPTYFERRLAREHYADAYASALAIDRMVSEGAHVLASPPQSDPPPASSSAPTGSVNGGAPPRRKRGRPPKVRPQPDPLPDGGLSLPSQNQFAETESATAKRTNASTR